MQRQTHIYKHSHNYKHTKHAYWTVHTHTNKHKPPFLLGHHLMREFPAEASSARLLCETPLAPFILKGVLHNPLQYSFRAVECKPLKPLLEWVAYNPTILFRGGWRVPSQTPGCGVWCAQPSKSPLREVACNPHDLLLEWLHKKLHNSLLGMVCNLCKPLLGRCIKFPRALNCIKFPRDAF